MNTNLVQHDPVIVRLMQASTALAEAKSIQQTKSILDVAAAAEIYAKRQQLGEDAIGIAHAIKIEALRKLGEMLKDAPKSDGARGLGGGGTRGSKKEPRVNAPPTLSELGLDKKTSSVAQKLAELSEEAFEQVRDGHETIARAIAAVKKAKDVEKVTGKRPGAKKPAVPDTGGEDSEINPETGEFESHADYEYRIRQGLADTIAAQHEHITSLLERQTVAGMEIPESEQVDILETITELRKEVKTLSATLDAVSAMRDQYMSECAQLKKQCAAQARTIKKLESSK